MFFYIWPGGGVNRKEIDEETIHMENVDSSLECIDVASELGCKVFIDSGSRAEYGNVNGIVSEDMECHPTTAYGKAKYKFYKLAKEKTIQKALTYYHLRIFSVYGYGDHPWGLISTLTRKLDDNDKVEMGPCLHYWNFLHIKDAAFAIYCLAERGLNRKDMESEIVNIASEESKPLFEYVHEIHRCTERRGILEFGTNKEKNLREDSLIADVRKMFNLLPDYIEKYSFSKGIKELLAMNRAGK